MQIIKLFRHILNNKVIMYLLTRYLTYFIQFLTSLLIAQKLGPENLGVWGFYLLIYCYLTFITFGIPNSLNILSVQNRDNKKLSQQIFDNAFISVLGLCFLIIIFCLSYFKAESLLNTSIKIGINILIIGVIAMLNQVNTLYATIYRVKNRLFGMAFHQSATQFIVLVIVLLFNGESLLRGLLLSYLLGEFFSFIVFKLGRQIVFSWSFSLSGVKLILRKGFYLFLYNTGFYFIILSTRSCIQTNFPIKDFGCFTFAYTIANSVLLLLQTFSYLLFPKFIDKYKTNDPEKVKSLSNLLLDTNVTLSYFLILIVIPCFPILLHFMPQYENTYSVISYTSLTVLLYSNAVYGSFLMAHNKEKLLAVISVVALLSNIIISNALVHIADVSYENVVFAMMLAYFIYSYMITLFSQKLLGGNTGFLKILNEFFPKRLLIPYLVELGLIIIHANTFFLCLNILLFLYLNRKQFICIFNIVKMIIVKPQIVDLSH